MGVMKEVIGGLGVRFQVSGVGCQGIGVVGKGLYHKNPGLSTDNIVRFLNQNYVVDYLVEHK